MTCQSLGISSCTFLEPPPRKRRALATDVPGPVSPVQQQATVFRGHRPVGSQGAASTSPSQSVPIEADDQPFDYPQQSLLTKTLGLEKGRFSELIGPGGEHDWQLLQKYRVGDSEPIAAAGPGQNAPEAAALHAAGVKRTMRKVNEGVLFSMAPDAAIPQYLAKNQLRAEVDIDDIEMLARPHGPALIKLYFRIVHPSFPILHKEVFIEKYNRTYREINPHLLAAVYALAVRWWSYDAGLLLEKKVDEAALVKIALQSVQDAVHRPRLNTIQAGLLLLQRHRDPFFADNSWMWSFTSSLIGLGQHLGLHLDCSDWAIPEWEKGLRRRLAWALFTQDAFAAMILGRPCLISPTDWAVAPLQSGDFSESSKDEEANSYGGSVSIEDGKLLFIELAKLSDITARVLRELYSVDSLATVTECQQVLAVAKPLGNELADLLQRLPANLKMDNLQQVRLCANGFFHLALQATAVVLHRRLLWSMHASAAGVDAQFVHFFRAAQRQRAKNLVQFVSRLRPEHMEAFWFFAAGGCGVIIGSFLGLVRVTSTTVDESEELKALMDEFEWQLRIKAKMGEWVSYTLTRLRMLGWDDWKNTEPDFAANAADIGAHSKGLPNVLETDRAALSSHSTINGLQHGTPELYNSTTWLTEDLDGLSSNFLSLEDGFEFPFSLMTPMLET
ncbi:hypothetical protein A1O1_09261 [Capronia coronata CBS 617.96]|uniref:Xylanolytic transcriptional activator regulatory domain-containing protein n=1 Tax=Capronia coronata CBS 617.96 TaxID=1182541 RepID=W9Y922_9EURO|nr:uncharacterized protein A1O1_09261 [Capronia coronata CBS 617.96]EXJ78859.1 hypothetical protein A1O1_09261 [Capronia coronata CBS 617.96]